MFRRSVVALLAVLTLLLLSLLPAGHAALLDDPAGDVAVRHFEQQQTPVPGWEAMDLVALDVEETPDLLRFHVRAAGLEGTADYDAGNHFVYVARGENHYTVRMIQDNSGTAVVSELLQTEGRGVFGTLLARLAASIDEATGTITTDVPRHLLLDQDGAAPMRGSTLTGIVASAEAHATGVYTDGFMGLEGGPLIVGDRMPDAWGDGATLTFQYGGGSSSGPVTLDVTRPYRASNGEATIYVLPVRVNNTGDAPLVLTLATEGMPDGWEARLPGDRLALQGGESATFDAYLRVPFQHVHGLTQRAELVATADADTWARAEFGVHHLTVPQPSGHHPDVWLHSAARMGTAALGAALGGGDNALTWNTLEEDEQDQRLPMSGVADGDGTAFWWTGCLSPGLALGVTVDPAAVGLAVLTFQSQAPLTGTVSGRLSVVERADRGAHCHAAHTWPEERTEIAVLEATPSPLDGTPVELPITPTAAAPVEYRPGMDLLLELRVDVDPPLARGDGVDLLPGGRLRLPLLDHHEPAPAVLPGDNGTTAPRPEQFVAEPEEAEESPAAAVGLVLLAVGAAAARRRTG